MKNLDPAQTKAFLDAHPEAAFVDVRSEVEFADGHPVGAVNVPLMHLSAMGRSPNGRFIEVIQGLFPDRSQPLVLACRVGGRSSHAGMMLEQLGYTQIINMDGGYAGRFDPHSGGMIAGWADRGLPISNTPAAGASYEDVLERVAG